MTNLAHKGFVVGKLREDAIGIDRGGWLVGSFFPQEGRDSDRHVREMEVKYWEYSPGGAGQHGLKVSATLEWSMILTGSTVAQLGEEEVILSAGDYVLIMPNTPNNLVSRVVEKVAAVTVKAPSDPAAKKLL